MENIYFSFLTLRQESENLLKDDNIEAALLLIFDFLERNHDNMASRISNRISINISASVSRLKKYFLIGIIDWDQTNKIRSELIEECISVLEIIGRDIQENIIEKRNMPYISGFSHLFSLPEVLENIENLLTPYMKK